MNATIVTEKPTPATDTVTDAIVSSRLRALSRSVNEKIPKSIRSARSTTGSTKPSTRPAKIPTAGRNPKLRRRTSRSVLPLRDFTPVPLPSAHR